VLLKLLKRASRFDCLMLAHVADQEHFVCYGIEAGKEFVEILCAGERAFIEHKKTLHRCRLFLSPADKLLEGFGLNSTLLELLRGACGGRKTAYLIAFFFGYLSDHGKRRGLAGARAAKTTALSVVR